MADILLVGIGGILGAQARFGLSNWFARRLGTNFPYGTLFINLTGSVLLALFTGLPLRANLTDPTYRYLIAVGFCGGYTTFSTYCFETLILLREGHWQAGLVLNWLGSWGLGLIGALIGWGLGQI
jgi:CrcB protein